MLNGLALMDTREHKASRVEQLKRGSLTPASHAQEDVIPAAQDAGSALLVLVQVVDTIIYAMTA